MGYLTQCLKFCVIALNFILVFGSLILIAFGVLFRVGAELDFVDSLETPTKSKIRDVISSTGIGDVDTIDRFSFTDLLSGWVANTMIGTGVVFFMLSFSGCCGAWYNIRCLLLVYIILLIIAMFLEVLLLSLAFGVPSTIQGQIKRLLEFSLKDFQGLAGTNDQTLGWMFVMKYYECCGIESYTDFKEHSNAWNTGTSAPLICCKSAITSRNDRDCAMEGASMNVYTEGCFDVVWNKVLSRSMYTYVTMANVFIFQILLIVCSIKFYRDSKKKKAIHPFKVPLKKMKR